MNSFWQKIFAIFREPKVLLSAAASPLWSVVFSWSFALSTSAISFTTGGIGNWGPAGWAVAAAVTVRVTTVSSVFPPSVGPVPHPFQAPTKRERPATAVVAFIIVGEIAREKSFPARFP